MRNQRSFVQPAIARPIDRTDEEVRLFLTDLMTDTIDPLLLDFFGAPVRAGVIVFPCQCYELVTWAANAPASERPQLAMAMVQLLERWGYLNRH